MRLALSPLLFAFVSLAALSLAALPLAAAPSVAAESDAVHSARATASVVSDTDRVAQGVPFQIGLRLQLAPGWHTYWRNPGDAGVPPEVTVDGAKAGPIAWPTPQRLPEGPLMTYGYTGSVLLPMTITPGAGAQHLEITANWLVCEKICVPEEGRFSLDLPAGTPSPSAQAPLFAAAQPPRPSPFQAHVAPNGTLSLDGAPSVKDAWFIPDGDATIDGSAPQAVENSGGALLIHLRPGSQFKPGATLSGIVVLRDGQGPDSALQVEATPGPAPGMPLGMPLGRAMLFALLGGLILNLMPCVFPILAMKAIGLARLSGHERREVRAHGASYTAGVVLAFAALGGLLLLARAAGTQAGWGFQFQSPAFVSVMAWVLFLVGLNLSGVFEIGGRLAGVGQGAAVKRGHFGSFFTGLLAVVVATPCTAPFMGAAIAAGLTSPPALTLLIFVAMGVGMAAPYGLLALAPGLAAVLPRPGRWMDVLRGALAFPMYGASIWLLWVASIEIGEAGVLAVATGALVLAAGAWVLGLAQQGGRRRVGAAAVVTSVFGAAVILSRLSVSPAPTPAAETASAERFTPARLASLRAEGRPVFVNMTAAWCVTCLVNERIALSPEAVKSAFARHDVAYLKGDWTSGDPAVTSFLREHMRDGVPLYVLYPRGDAGPIVLPQILTEAQVLSELDKLGG